MKKSSYEKTYILLDAHAIIHRAYHAMGDLSTSAGKPTGALYGIMSMLIRVMNEIRPDYIIACYDLPQKTFRHIAYEAYKGTRAKTDDALIAQIIESRRIFEACDIPIYDAPGYEADDVLGTIATILKKDKKNKIIIASGDMDTMQLIDDDQVIVYTLKGGMNDTVFYNEQAVLDRYTFPPTSIPDYKGLRGDTSDNIIGIKGIGEKTATILIEKYKTIETMYKALKKDVAKFKTDTGLTDRLVGLIADNEEEALFSKELATIQCDVPIVFTPSILHKSVFDTERVVQLCKEYEFRSLITKVHNIYNDNPIVEEKVTKKEQESTNKKAVAEIDPLYMLAVSLLDSEKIKPTAEDFYMYGSKDDIEQTKKTIEQEIQKNKLTYVWEEIEKPLFPIVESMSHTGIEIDIPYFKKLSTDFHKELTILEGKIWKLAGVEFNINSPKQMGEILFTTLNLAGDKKIKKTAGGAITTKESELEKLRDAHPIIALILEYREIQKLVSTYIDSIPLLVGTDGRIHSTFNQLGAATGRFSSTDPNMQNIPTKTERGRMIRRGFVAKQGNVLLGFDYSQIELRVGALLSQDKDMLDTFIKGEDIHTAVAKKVFDVTDEGVTADMRRRAKVINFGIMYGMGAGALAENLGVPRKEAQEFLEAYKKQFTILNSYLVSVIDFAKEHKYTTTFFGRKRNFNKINSVIPFIRAMYERMAINAPVQGTAADIIKCAMINVDTAIKKEHLDGAIRLVLQVHDEIIFEVIERDVERAKSCITKAMQDIIPDEFKKNYTIPPFSVTVAVGKTWADLK
jgi:DNA polymerase-1